MTEDNLLAILRQFVRLEDQYLPMHDFLAAVADRINVALDGETYIGGKNDPRDWVLKELEE